MILSDTPPTHQRLPDGATLLKASTATVFDEKGEKVVFGSLIENQKTIVVFIRHFFCGACQAYVMNLAEIPPHVLDKSCVKLVVIGCGGWQAIKLYKETTSLPYDIYADPSRKLYDIFGLLYLFTRRPAGEEPRKYTKGSTFLGRVISTSFKYMIHPMLSLGGKTGDVKQNGGDFIFGPGLKCEFANRMRHTEDHVDVEDLLRAAGINLTV